MISFEMVLPRSTGIAKPSPMLPPDDSPVELGTVAPAVGMPMSSPEQFTRAPPLLPGLIAASVCTADTRSAELSFSAGTSTVRSSALTMPEVTVPDRPSGAPRTTTGWPTRTESDEPIAMAFRLNGGLTLRTARSVRMSRPTIVAGTVVPDANVTSTLPPLAAGEMTWLLVRM
jgi:hypothetical protein